MYSSHWSVPVGGYSLLTFILKTSLMGPTFTGLFSQEILKHGSHFLYKNIPINMGPLFPIVQNFVAFATRKLWKMNLISKKSLKMATFYPFLGVNTQKYQKLVYIRKKPYSGYLLLIL